MLIKHIPKIVERGVLLRLIGHYLLWKDNTQASSKSKHAIRLERDLPVPHLIFANWVDHVFLFHATVFSGCGPVAYAIRPLQAYSRRQHLRLRFIGFLEQANA